MKDVFSNSFTGFFRLALVAALVLMLSAPALAKNPYTYRNNTWISLSGTVTSVSPDSFILDYGEGAITVEMDDGDRDADAYKLLAGDKVTVNGLIDDDFYETTTIEASSVYVEKLDTYFFASAVDEEFSEKNYLIDLSVPVVISAVAVQGTVTSTSEDEFVLNTGLRSVRVEVEEMANNPLDDKGFLKIKVGDLVRVTGSIDYDFIEGREIVADSVVKFTN